MINLEFYSPEEKVEYPLFEKKGIELYIKRDDLIHPFISGNKWRKLKYNLLKAEEQKKNHLITFGGAYSNHILATAAAGAKFGLNTTAFIRGEEVENEILSFCKIYGMQLIFTDRETYKNKSKLFQEHYEENQNAYFIDEGGAGKEAELGCREIVKELKQNYDHLFCAAGTGTTSAGIINEIANQNLNTIFNMIPVLKGGSFLKDDISSLLEKNHQYEIHTDYHFGGYAKTQTQLIDFIKDLAEKDFFQHGSKILMIHTGGIFGILGMLDKFK